jgi:hypothetical protein
MVDRSGSRVLLFAGRFFGEPARQQASVCWLFSDQSIYESLRSQMAGQGLNSRKLSGARSISESAILTIQLVANCYTIVSRTGGSERKRQARMKLNGSVRKHTDIYVAQFVGIIANMWNYRAKLHPTVAGEVLWISLSDKTFMKNLPSGQ